MYKIHVTGIEWTAIELIVYCSVLESRCPEMAPWNVSIDSIYVSIDFSSLDESLLLMVEQTQAVSRSTQ